MNEEISIEELPEFPREFLRFRGFKTLNPPQYDALKHLVTANPRNLIIAIPTGAGKTLIGEMGIARVVLFEKKKAAYLTPLIALANEKFQDFKPYEEQYRIKVAVRTGEYQSSERDLSRYDVIISTYEKWDSMTRHAPDWLNDVGIVVVDEAHMVTDIDRGPVLECMLTRMMKKYPHARLLLLSAVMPNVDQFAKWLDAETVKSDWRAVPLKKGVFSWSKVIEHSCGSTARRLTPKCRGHSCGKSVAGAIQFTDGSVRKIDAVKVDAAIPALAVDIIREGGQALIFAKSRAETVKQAQNVGSIVSQLVLKEDEKRALRQFVQETRDNLTGAVLQLDETSTLLSAIENGAAFHNAGMHSDLKGIVEDGYRRLLIKVIAATPTLAAGVNLPARRVIIQTIYRWTRTGSEKIPRWELENSMGRAGRRRYDKYGEAVLIGEESGALADGEEDPIMTYLKSPVEDIESKLFTRTGILSHMLAEIAKESGADRKYIADFFSSSFGAKSGQIDKSVANQVVSDSFNFLIKNGLIMPDGPDGKFIATNLGHKFNQMYINPESIENIRAAFAEARRKGSGFGFKPSAFSWLHLMCTMVDWDFRPINERILDEIYFNQSELLLEPTATNYQAGLEGGLVFNDYIEEVSQKQICERFRIGTSDIRKGCDNAEWLLSALLALAPVMGYQELTGSIGIALARVRKGVKEELLSLTSLKQVGRDRARHLFQVGIKTREQLLLERNYPLAARTLGEGVLRRILEENGVDVSKIEPIATRQMTLG